METKICKKCGNEKSVSEFHKKDSQTQINCKECAILISKEWYRNNKTNNKIKSILYDRSKEKEKYFIKMANKIKEFFGCSICKEKDSCCLDFHHISSEDKIANVSTWVRKKSENKIIEEIKKCICVCANCHRKIHANKIESPDCFIDLITLQKIVNDFKQENPWISKHPRVKKEKMKNPCLYCKKFTTNNKYCSKTCCDLNSRKKVRPEKQVLFDELKRYSINQLSKKYSISNRTMEKWIKYYNK